MTAFITPFKNKSFWVAAADRALRTFAQAAAAILTAGGVGLLDVDLAGAASAGALAALISVLTSIATPGFVGGAEAKEEPLADTDLDVDDIPGGEVEGVAAEKVDAEPDLEEGLGK